MRDAEIAVVWDAHLGGHPVCLLGLRVRPLPRLGWVPAYGPDQWTGGTLFPRRRRRWRGRSTRRAATGRWSCSPTSRASTARRSRCASWQLEYGAEIGRAVVELPGADRVLRRLPLPRRRVRGVLRDAQRQHGGGGARGLLRLGDRRRARRGRGVRPRGGQADEEGPAGGGAREGHRRPRARRKRGRPARRSWGDADAVRSEKLGEVAEEFDASTASSGPAQVGSVHTSSRRSGCGPT